MQHEYYDVVIDAQHPLFNLSCWEGIRFEQCRFEGLNLPKSQWRYCVFDECEFSHCDLSMLGLNNSQFHSALFSDCKLLGIDWAHADWPANLGDSPKFTRCLLNAGSFFGLNLQGLCMIDCKVHDVDFSEGGFVKAIFCGSELTHSRFHNTDLRQADFSEAHHYQIDVRQNRLDKARFSRIDALGLLDSLGIELL